MRQFQIHYDFEGLTQEVNNERKRVYLEPEAYQFLKNAPGTAQLNGQKNFKYVNREQYVTRIRRAKQSMAAKKKNIWTRQDIFLKEEEERKAREEIERLYAQTKVKRSDSGNLL